MRVFEALDDPGLDEFRQVVGPLRVADARISTLPLADQNLLRVEHNEGTGIGNNDLPLYGFFEFWKGVCSCKIVDRGSLLWRAGPGEVFQTADQAFHALCISPKHIGKGRNTRNRRVQRLGILVEDSVNVT